MVFSNSEELDSVDIRPWPPIELVGRAVALTTVARRGALEVDSSASEFEIETDRFDLSTWARTDLLNWITDSEIQLLETPVGRMTDDQLSACDDALVSATTIAWVLRVVDTEQLPLPENTALDETTLTWAPDAWGKVRPLANAVRIRSDEELARERERWEIWYWRAVEADNEDSIAAVAQETESVGLIQTSDRDICDDAGVRFGDMDQDTQSDIAWIAGLRLHALNWACGLGESWDTTSLILED